MEHETLAMEAADVFYGAAQALHGVSLSVARGEVVALAGRNGAGKSTTLKAMSGLLPLSAGVLRLDGKALSTPTPEDMNRGGIAYVPEDRQIFPTLTVEENLAIAKVVRRGGSTWGVDDAFALFPRLAERRRALGQALSGGEKQMLAIGRAMICAPRFLLLDEPMEGLAPNIVSGLVESIRSIVATGVGVILVEQNFRVPAELASRFVILDSGRVGWAGDKAALETDTARVSSLLSGTAAT
ncbi:ABC transporter ATP-binding protein [Amorphus orientalis]|uniref:Branched-chain amino acid transport system ATP-binding protein n=1 Tax=Amorphus orientalis TaxID=649198 RepID=A0AAE4AU32_9HYPH|nr:ABC transporter ATP-binding protein [Amorphus orientalis]MDQ0316890.1 branched-chain amino acid transport system ATP-binding protein [Amorphus orientalis]